MPNSPIDYTGTEVISIVDRDVAQCRTLHQFAHHPKFLQFLAIYNRHRQATKSANQQVEDLTLDDLIRSPSAAEDANSFFQGLHLETSPAVLQRIQGIVTDSLTSIEKRRGLLQQVHEVDTNAFPSVLAQQ